MTADISVKKALKPKARRAPYVKYGNIKLTAKFDKDVDEYTPQKTSRDKARRKSEIALEKNRQAFKEREVEIQAQKAAMPKKPLAPKREIWNVESILNMKEVDGKKYYLVKWEGYKKPGWETEENVLDSQQAINDYLQNAKERKEEKLKLQKLAVEGKLEVSKIMAVDIKMINKKTKRNFLVRWKGAAFMKGTWVLEEKLDCTDKIKAFMLEKEKKATVNRGLREAPKSIQRLEYASKTESGKRSSKKNKGFRKTYEGMDKSNTSETKRSKRSSKENKGSRMSKKAKKEIDISTADETKSSAKRK